MLSVLNICVEQIQKNILSQSCIGAMLTRSVLGHAMMKLNVLRRRCAMHIRNRWLVY